MSVHPSVVCLSLLLLAAVASAKTQWHDLEHGYTFEKYKQEFMRDYGNAEEEELRRTVFEKNLAAILTHNKGDFTWKEGVNKFTDATDDELTVMKGYSKTLGAFVHKPVEPMLDTFDGPTSVDWRTYKPNIVSAVKDQGQCGSCYSFATTETLEAHYARKTGVLPVLSEQEIMDCTPNPQHCGGTGGCAGGTAEISYLHLKKTGIASEWTYPYTGYHGAKTECKFNPDRAATPAVVNITGHVKLPSNQYSPLMEAVAKLGPIAISVEASHWSKYEEGVFDGCNQTNPDIDHAVQLVGYGTDAKLGDYWLVRNSWSPGWGENGYIRLRRTSSEQTRCGTDITPADGSGCTGGPKTVKVCGTCGILYDTCYPTV